MKHTGILERTGPSHHPSQNIPDRGGCVVAEDGRDTPHTADLVPVRMGSPSPLIPPAWQIPARLRGVGDTARPTCKELPKVLVSSCSLTPTPIAFTMENCFNLL